MKSDDYSTANKWAKLAVNKYLGMRNKIDAAWKSHVVLARAMRSFEPPIDYKSYDHDERMMLHGHDYHTSDIDHQKKIVEMVFEKLNKELAPLWIRAYYFYPNDETYIKIEDRIADIARELYYLKVNYSYEYNRLLSKDLCHHEVAQNWYKICVNEDKKIGLYQFPEEIKKELFKKFVSDNETLFLPSQRYKSPLYFKKMAEPNGIFDTPWNDIVHEYRKIEDSIVETKYKYYGVKYFEGWYMWIK